MTTRRKYVPLLCGARFAEPLEPRTPVSATVPCIASRNSRRTTVAAHPVPGRNAQLTDVVCPNRNDGGDTCSVAVDVLAHELPVGSIGIACAGVAAVTTAAITPAPRANAKILFLCVRSR